MLMTLKMRQKTANNISYKVDNASEENSQYNHAYFVLYNYERLVKKKNS